MELTTSNPTSARSFLLWKSIAHDLCEAEGHAVKRSSH